MDHLPQLVTLNWQQQYRIIPSVYPPVNFFEELVDASEMETLWYIEGLTNDRLREQVGDIFLVNKEDRVCGPGSSVVMAAFTHIGKKTRFSDGSYGIYYASKSLETAVRETAHHREKFLASTQEKACELTMRVYTGKVKKPLHDIRDKHYNNLHHPTNYLEPQSFAKELRDTSSWGLVYRSGRHQGGECIAALRPPTVSIPIQSSHLAYVWNGQRITTIYEKSKSLFAPLVS